VFSTTYMGGARQGDSFINEHTGRTTDLIEFRYTPEGTIQAKGESGAGKNNPRYYKLAYIMKL